MTITLAQLEQETARRTGPFFQASQDSGVPTSSTTIAAYMPTLRSSAVLGGPENLFLVRRGVLSDGTPTPVAVTAGDRVRMVLSFDSSAGRVVVDRNWRDPMQPDELADFVHLHPEQELRRAIMAGLRRCFSQDRGRVYPNLEGGQYDLTEIQPWITSPAQVLRLQGGVVTTGGDIPFQAVAQGGHVLLVGNTPATPGGAWLTALRPAWTWVNDAESTTGPVADSDELDIDLDYAAAAAHIEAWHLFPSRMFMAAAGGMQATQQMAAQEFTRQTMIWCPPTRGEIGFSEVVRVTR